MTADDHVGVLVGRLEDAVERLLHRVGEHEGAAHHRDADDHRERGEEGADLAAGEPLEGDLDHRAVTSSSAWRIAWALERGRSLTISPSARNSTRSAIAAACA